RLVLHDVTPVAGGIADGEKNRLVLSRSLRKGCLPPRVPVDRIGGMLEEIGARGEDQPVELRPAVGRKSALVDLDQAPDPFVFILQIAVHMALLQVTARSLSDLGNRSENSAGRDQILPILKVNSCSIDRKSSEI